MQRWLLAALLMLGIGVTLGAQSTTITLTPTDTLAFDYLDADLTGSSVTQFAVSWDGGALTSIGLPTAFLDANTLPGAHSYKLSVPFTNGNHSLALAACNAVGCGPVSATVPFAVVSPPASSPTNIRKVAK